ncbi:hypothetical protein [Lacipirellula sp.]|uniref:hypothetical protein n=1 Tax=Lacipirellula sp. TaxID=2691419 RepID=UPI003D10C2C4
MGDSTPQSGGVNFTSLGWFTLATARKLLGDEEYHQLREAIQFKEIRITRFGNEYLLDHDDWLAWVARAA